jgi:hypothetical protein
VLDLDEDRAGARVADEVAAVGAAQ